MRATMLGLVFLMIVGVSQGQAGGYKVTKVIEVGPAATVIGMSGSVKWSPDGTMLAYFANNFLMVSDTLGNSRQVAAISEQYPVRAEWASDTEFAVRLKGEKRSDSTLYQLMVYDIVSGKSRLVDEYWRHRWSLMPGNVCFEGPYVTLEGNAYYLRVNITGDEKGDMIDRRKSARFEREKLPVSTRKAAALQQDHLIRWDADSVYRVSWMTADSERRYADRVHSPLHPGTTVSASGVHIFRDGTLVNRTTSDTIDVRAYAGVAPLNTHSCGFLRPVFNPVAPELLFQYYCEGEDPYVVDRVGTFNYETREFVLLDTLTAFGAWQLPEYAPNGRMIALTSGYKAYIVWREIEQ